MLIRKNNLNRRKFLKILIFGFLITSANNNFLLSSQNKVIILPEETIKEIQIHNLKRKSELTLNYFGEIKKDLRENKTIWFKKDLYTYAELKNFQFKVLK